MERRELSRRVLPSLLGHMTAALAANRGRIDDLNVFPVPDGDTGSNLYLTVRAGRDAIAGSGVADDVATTARRAMLRGARGNSGVIMSQVLAAFVDVLDDGPVDAAGVRRMLAGAGERARAAVSDPVEGTILTVLDAASAAAGTGPDDEDLPTLVRRIADVVAEAVVATEHQLAANRDAGVVDAGAEGFAVVWRALADHLDGHAPPDAPQEQENPHVAHHATGDMGPAYEVMYVIELDDASAREDTVATLRRRFAEIGDSVVVVGDGDLVQAHVHTDDVGAAIAVGERLGSTSDVRVTRFADQVGACAEDPEPQPPTAAVGWVAVVPGPGIAAVVADLGATVVQGAAGDLPNVAVLLEAVGRTRADTVVILPGHPNAVPTARQAAAVSRAEGGRDLPVVASATSVPALVSVLMDAVANDGDVAAAEQVAATVVAGEVVPAVRDADLDIGHVRTGQWLGVVDGEIVVAGDRQEDVVLAVVERLPVVDLVTLYAGVSAADRDGIVAAVRVLVGGEVEVEVVDGGQEPAAWIVGVE